MKNIAIVALCLCMAWAQSVQADPEFDTFDEPCWQDGTQKNDKVFRVDAQRLLLLWRGTPYLIRPDDRNVLLLNGLGRVRGKSYLWPKGRYRGVSLHDDLKIPAGEYSFVFEGQTVRIQQKSTRSEVRVDFASCVSR